MLIIVMNVFVFTDGPAGLLLRDCESDNAQPYYILRIEHRTPLWMPLSEKLNNQSCFFASLEVCVMILVDYLLSEMRYYRPPEMISGVKAAKAYEPDSDHFSVYYSVWQPHKGWIKNVK